MRLDELPRRDLPANLIPGWLGSEEVVHGHFDGDGISDRAVVALAGGSVRVRVVSGADGSTIFDTIVFDPDFRGGGHLAVIPHSYAEPGLDSLLVVPGDGGGPVVTQFDFDGGVESHTFFAPFEETFRGGLLVAGGDVDGDGRPEAIFLGGSRLVAVDLRTHETETSIFVDGPGEPQFETTGAMYAAPFGFLVQYGPTVGVFAPSRVWALDGTLLIG